MAYTNGSITNADPAGSILTQIETALTAHANWTKVESYTLSTNLYDVWRNNGTGVGDAANTLGSDFYLIFERPAASTITLRVKASEGYTPASGTPANARMLKAVTPSSTAPTNMTPLSDGTRSNAASLAPSDTTTLGYVGLSNLPTTGFDWFVIVSRDYVRMGVKTPSASSGIEMGLFDTLLPGGSGPTDTFPLYIAGGSSTNSTLNQTTTIGYVSYSRSPNLPDLTARAYLWGGNISTSSADTGPQLGGPGQLSGANYSDRFQGTGAVLAPSPVFKNSASGDYSIIGAYRGKPKDTICVAQDVSGAGIGDEWTGGGVVYVNWRTANQSVWVKRDVS